MICGSELEPTTDVTCLLCAGLLLVRRVIGDISVRRVAGKLHFAVHQQSFVDVLPQVRTRAASRFDS